ncbi:MAG TPA: hypothetical protein VFV82_00345 [Candidatus Binatia bacterium]|nr:hypothetical protein [Candidatus Binatia bacterium]
MDTIRFVDTTIRDGIRASWAENMTMGMRLLPSRGATGTEKTSQNTTIVEEFLLWQNQK